MCFTDANARKKVSCHFNKIQTVCFCLQFRPVHCSFGLMRENWEAQVPLGEEESHENLLHYPSGMKSVDDGKQIRYKSPPKVRNLVFRKKKNKIKNPNKAIVRHIIDWRHPTCYYHNEQVFFPLISVSCSFLCVTCKLTPREAQYLSRSHLHGVRGVRLATEVQTGSAESMAEADPSSLPGRESFTFQSARWELSQPWLPRKSRELMPVSAKEQGCTDSAAEASRKRQVMDLFVLLSPV